MAATNVAIVSFAVTLPATYTVGHLDLNYHTSNIILIKMLSHVAYNEILLKIFYKFLFRSVY